MAPPSPKENGDGTTTLLRNMGGCTSTSQGRWGWHIHLLNNMRHLQSHKGDGYATFTLLKIWDAATVGLGELGHWGIGRIWEPFT